MSAPPSREVLVTGVTGFIGKVILEGLVRRREELGVERVHVLIRPKAGEDAGSRFRREVARSRCFQQTPAGWESAVEVVSGELTQRGCGVDDAARAELGRRVTHVIHSAASVEFDQPLADAFRDNVTGSLHLLELAKDLPHLESLVSLSTAYVTPHPGPGRPVEESLAPLPRAAEDLEKQILAGEADEAALLAESGHPNTYTFSKCIAEHLLVQRRDGVPLTLVRPSIVSASWREPFPGWIDSYAAFAAFVMAIGSGQLRAVAADPEVKLDVVPCDEVARRAIDSCLGESRPEPQAGSLVPILHAVAGVANACRIDLCGEAIVGFFRDNPLGPIPRLRYVGRHGPAFRWNEWLHHDARLSAGAAWFGVTRKRVRGLTPGALRQRLRYLNRAFSYFTHHTFDFQSSVPFETPDFDPFTYVGTVSEGVHALLRGGTRARRRKQDAPPGRGLPASA